MELSYSIVVGDEMKEQLRQLSMTLNAYTSSFHTKLKSRTTKSRNRKEITSAVKELIDSQENPQKALPVGVNQELQGDHSTSLMSGKLKKTDAKDNINGSKESRRDSRKDS